MANTKSAKKAQRSSLRKNLNNGKWKRNLLKAKKLFLDNLESNSKKEVVTDLLVKAKKVVDKASTHGSLHKNKSARVKSMLDKKFHLWAKLAHDEKPA